MDQYIPMKMNYYNQDQDAMAMEIESEEEEIMLSPMGGYMDMADDDYDEYEDEYEDDDDYDYDDDEEEISYMSYNEPDENETMNTPSYMPYKAMGCGMSGRYESVMKEGEKFIVVGTANGKKGSTISKAMDKKAADDFKKNLEKEMSMAVDAYKWAKDLKVVKESVEMKEAAQFIIFKDNEPYEVVGSKKEADSNVADYKSHKDNKGSKFDVKPLSKYEDTLKKTKPDAYKKLQDLKKQSDKVSKAKKESFFKEAKKIASKDSQEYKDHYWNNIVKRYLNDIKDSIQKSKNKMEKTFYQDRYAAQLKDFSKALGIGEKEIESKLKESFFKEAKDVQGTIDELIKTGWGGSNEEQMKAVQLLKFLATSDDPKSNAFMKKLDAFTSGMKSEKKES